MNPRLFLMASGLLFASAIASSFARGDDFIAIGTGRLTVVRAGESIATVAVGDPSVADVTVEGDRSIMVFGKRPGQTDLVLIGHNQRQILRSRIVVGTMGGEDTVIVRRPGNSGMEEEAWFCAPNCARVPGNVPGAPAK
ncbi:MAG: pilus assembly protein N-terminal domain-containing protein [Rhodospirillaceae bacterium]